MTVLDSPLESYRLTQFSHGGGCGCKVAPALLQELVAKAAPFAAVPQALLVGTEPPTTQPSID